MNPSAQSLPRAYRSIMIRARGSATISGSMSTMVSSLPDRAFRDEVADVVTRLLARREFASAGRSAQLLRYLVDETLGGRPREIKEIVVAVALFARADDYDPKTRSAMRVEASRLRA